MSAIGTELAEEVNLGARGWMRYYGAVYRSALYSLLHRINTYFLRWSMNKYRRLNTWKKATQAMRDAIQRNFEHWSWTKPAPR